MAYVTPTSRSAGYTVPSTEWNKNTVDNPIALYTGAKGISGATAGDVVIQSTTTQEGVVSPGASGTVLTSNGAGVAPSFQALATSVTVLNRDVTTATAGPSSVVETTMYSFTVPGGTLGSTKTLRCSVIGDFLNTTGGTGGYTIKVKYGATTVLTHVYAAGTSANRGSLAFTAWLSANNATGTQVARGEFYSGNGSANNATGTSSTNINVAAAVDNSVSEDSTGDLAFAITITMSASSATLEAKVFSVLLELV